MKTLAPAFLVLAFLSLTGCPLSAQMMNHPQPMAPASPHSATLNPQERLGTVSFPISCPASQAAFNRSVALQHDFWYDEALPQFQQIVKSDPTCAMAHWGVAMAVFHQIWDRPDAETMKFGWAEMQKAQSGNAGTERERAYIAALADFYRPSDKKYQERIDAYSAAMGKLFEKYPDDVDAGAFYALSLLAARTQHSTNLDQQRKAMAVLTPLFAKYPDNPGVVHYIIHACDNPAMASDGLTAANHYGEIAQSGPHAFHMPGHIYARLGLWPQDVASQVGSIAASQAAEARGESGIMDEPHSYDFLLYAYLQSGQDTKAKAALTDSSQTLNKIADMSRGDGRDMGYLVPMYRVKLPSFYALEMRDWKTAAATQTIPGAAPEMMTQVYWVRAIADGHLRQPQQARADLAKYDALIAEIKKGKNAYLVEGTYNEIEHNEMEAWAEYAEGKRDDALAKIRAAADMQDKVGQAEVDIPAREMLGDMLLSFDQPKEALAEYEVSLRHSPNRLNGLYGAGQAGEAAGDKAKAQFYYAALLKSTNNGVDSARPEFAHAKNFAASSQQAAN
jgi:predicted Zn-dependent protease